MIVRRPSTNPDLLRRHAKGLGATRRRCEAALRGGAYSCYFPPISVIWPDREANVFGAMRSSRRHGNFQDSFASRGSSFAFILL